MRSFLPESRPDAHARDRHDLPSLTVADHAPGCALAAPAQAADVVYPAGSRIGLAPPPGMTVSQSFAGFEDRENRVALVIVTLPAAAYPDIEKSTTPELLQKQGVTLETREDVTHPLGKAFLVHRVVSRSRTQNIRKWIFVVPAGELTALVTMQVPEAAQIRLSGCRDPRRADERVGASDRAGRRAVDLAAVPRERACRLQGRRRDRRPRRHADRRSARPARQGHRHPHPGRACAGRSGAGRRSRPLRAGGVRSRAQPERRPDQLVRAAAHRRPARPPDHGTRARMARPATRSRSCSGCASAAAPTCTWSASRVRKAGRRPMRASGRCATASTCAEH